MYGHKDKISPIDNRAEDAGISSENISSMAIMAGAASSSSTVRPGSPQRRSGNVFGTPTHDIYEIRDNELH